MHDDRRKPADPRPPHAARHDPPGVIITGFMGTGKSLVGRCIADMLGLDFVDTDQEIERTSGMSIGDIFEKHGEARFRELERSVCEDLGRRRGIVVTTGGGTLMDEENRRQLANVGKVVLLEAAVGVLCKRLENDASRPLIADASRDPGELRGRIETILAERAPVYDTIRLRFDTSSDEPQKTASKIAAGVAAHPETIPVSLLGGYLSEGHVHTSATRRGRHGLATVEVGRGALSTLGKRLGELGIDNHIVFLGPQRVLDEHRLQIEASVEVAGIPLDTLVIEDGESSKTLRESNRIIDRLVEIGAKRDSTIVPVGGGVTGDIGGFVASVFMRGVPLVHVPTTLLAQVDSAIGAKVAVNHPLAKNLIGSFYQPYLVLADPCVLRTLPLEELSNGMAEIVKTAFLGSAEFYAFLERYAFSEHDTPGNPLRNPLFLEHCVLESARIKARVVSRDPFERDSRRVLNLGHTIGHAIEASADYKGLRHGEAISLGLVAALHIAERRGAIEPTLRQRVVRLLRWCGLPDSFGSYDRTSLCRAVELDKKIKRGKLHFVLPTGLGSVEIVDDVTFDEILSTLEKG